MSTFLGLSGSLRSGSLNTALLRAASRLMPEASRLDIVVPSDIPLYNGDVEAEGVPASVTALKNQLARASGLLIATPEYNHGMPGVLKNVIDWMSRPPSDITHVFQGKPVAVIGASPSPFGTILAQNAWLPVLRALRMNIWSGRRLLVAHADEVFQGGEVVDDFGEREDVREQLRKFLNGFVEFAASS